MAEQESPISVCDEHLLSDCLADRVLKRAGLDPGYRGDHGLLKAAADGYRAGRPLCLERKVLDPEHERVAKALRGGATTVETGREQLLGVQRVALAASVQAVDERVVGRRIEDVFEHLCELSRLNGCSSIGLTCSSRSSSRAAVGTDDGGGARPSDR